MKSARHFPRGETIAGCRQRTCVGIVVDALLWLLFSQFLEDKEQLLACQHVAQLVLPARCKQRAQDVPTKPFHERIKSHCATNGTIEEVEGPRNLLPVKGIRRVRVPHWFWHDIYVSWRCIKWFRLLCQRWGGGFCGCVLPFGDEEIKSAQTK